jgi:hypothetical protein
MVYIMGIMEKQHIATIINFCSNESRFLGPCIEQARAFSQQIIIPVCDHFFDGTVENRALLEQIYRAFPDCLFVEYPYVPAEIPRRIFKEITPGHFWHSCSRLIGCAFVEPFIEGVLFLDADEIPEGEKFAEWLNSCGYHQHTVIRFANYWYFREPTNRALTLHDSIVLARKKALTPELILQNEERDALYDLLPGPKRRQVTGGDGAPMFHHYSWVRTHEEMIKKVQSWSRKGECNWIELVNQEFSGPMRETDFVYGYKYESVQPRFELGLTPPSKKEPRVIRLTQKQMLDLLKFKKNVVLEWISGLIQG